MQRRFLNYGLIILLATISLVALNFYRSIERTPTQNLRLIIGEFSLLNQNAQPINQNYFLGNHTLIFFGFTYCPDVCPTVLQTMSEGLDMLDKDSIRTIRPIFITIDPERDNPEVLKSYLENFHPLITGLTGDTEEIKNCLLYTSPSPRDS